VFLAMTVLKEAIMASQDESYVMMDLRLSEVSRSVEYK
jgi:hypothetical protein